jgi:hypothetical protein
MSEDDWLDATALGSGFEEQFNPRTNKWRYRDIRLKGTEDGWRPGHPPVTHDEDDEE